MGAASASAADLPVKAPPMVAPAFNWTGFYIGANVGYGWTESDDVKGVIGGGQIGYNYQTGSLVWGIELDAQGSAQKATYSAVWNGIPMSETDKIPWFATLRGRVGWAFADRWMVYATGGGALVDMKIDFSIPNATASWEESHGAWVVGAGIEQAFAQNWSWKVEYLYLDTGSFSTTVFGIPGTMHLKDNIVRAGVNYHF